MSKKAYFNKAAESWDKRFNTAALSFFLEKFVPLFGLEAGQHVLDVGTGTGVLIPYLIRAVGSEGKVTAVDYSEKMVKVCKTKHSHLKNVTVQLKSVEEGSFLPESFDAMVCFGVFPHLDNKEQALRNMNCALKPCGKLIIAHALSSEEIKVHHKNASSTVKHDTLPTKDEMTKLLEQTGFTGISIKDEPGSYLCIAHKV